MSTEEYQTCFLQLLYIDYLYHYFSQSDGAVEYTDCTSAEG